MPLRKKHVRTTVFVLLVAGVLGSLAALLGYGLHLRGGAYDRAIGAALASRLRCESAVRRARPTGLTTVAAESVHLAWTAGNGRLALALEDLQAKRNPDGTTWTVTAATGRLSLAGQDPAATLAALNQRLVQVGGDVPVTHLYIQQLHVALVLDPLRVSRDVRAVLVPAEDGLAVHLFDPAAMDRPSREVDAEALAPLAALRLAPASERGVFTGFHADLGLDAAAARRALGIQSRGAGAKSGGKVAVAVNWFWPEADPDAATVSVEMPDMDLAAWTAGAPGGPVEGAGTLLVRYRRDRDGATALAVHLAAQDGTISGPTLGWLDGLPAPLGGWGQALPERPERVPFDRLAVTFEMAGTRARFLGQADRWGGVPVVTVRLLGTDVPLLRVSPRPFDVAGLWAALAGGLGVGREHLREQMTGAVAVAP